MRQLVPSAPAADELSDDALVARVLDGELAAYDVLMQRYENRVLRIASGFAPTHDALDIAQEVFLRAYDKLESYRLGTNFGAWLLQIASNQGISWLRKQRRHRDGHEELESAECPRQWADPKANSDQRAIHSERHVQLLHCLQQIRPRYRAAIMARYFRELSIREIADELACSESVAKSLLFRGVRRLREVLEQEAREDWRTT